jgi:hypothetical protein
MISQRELAKRFGIGRSQVGNILRGESRMKRLEKHDIVWSNVKPVAVGDQVPRESIRGS